MEALVVELEKATVQQESISLQLLVGRLVAGTVSKAVRHGSFFVNDVSPALTLEVNADLVAAVLSQIVTTMVTHASNTCIRISATTSNGVVTLQVRDQHSNGNTYTVASSLKSVQPVAEQIGGYLGITSQDKNDTTVIFSFLNQS